MSNVRRPINKIHLLNQFSLLKNSSLLRKKANTTKIPVYRTITSRTKDLTIKDSLTQLVAVIITIENIKIKNTKAFVFLIRN